MIRFLSLIFLSFSVIFPAATPAATFATAPGSMPMAGMPGTGAATSLLGTSPEKYTVRCFCAKCKSAPLFYVCCCVRCLYCTIIASPIHISAPAADCGGGGGNYGTPSSSDDSDQCICYEYYTGCCAYAAQDTVVCPYDLCCAAPDDMVEARRDCCCCIGAECLYGGPLKERQAPATTTKE